jgi:protein gp37
MGKRLRAMALADLEAGRNPGRKAAYIEAVDARGRWTGKVPTLPDALGDPLKWRKPARVFVNSMSDLFHDAVPFEFIAAVFGAMAACPQHTFQVLTKRPARAVEFFRWAKAKVTGGGDPGWSLSVAWPLPNVHLGVSVENQETADARIPHLLQCPAAVHFVSYEPALGPVDFAPYLRPNWDVFVGPCGCSERRDPWTRCDNCIHTLRWVIVGGESGPSARPFDVAWARSTIEQCRAAGTKCFVKQLGARPEFNGAMGFVSESWKLKDKAGADPSEWPEDLRVQDFPNTPA